jgi:hypothetical protein
MAAKRMDFKKWKKKVPAGFALVCSVSFDPRYPPLLLESSSVSGWILSQASNHVSWLSLFRSVVNTGQSEIICHSGRVPLTF